MSANEKKDPRKKGHYVPSRYMQVAESFSKLSSHSKESTQEGKITESCVLSSTAVKNRVPLPLINASAITYKNDTICVPNRDKPSSSAVNISETYAQKNKEMSTKLGTTRTVKQQKVKSKQTANNVEKEIDLLYIEYLQAKLLESKAKKALKMRSKNALEKIHELWSLMQVLLRKNGAVKKDLEFVNYLIDLDKHLKRQEKFLQPTLETLSTLEKCYEEIATHVYFARHKLGTKDIQLPEPGSEGEIVELLDRIKSLLDTILSYIKNCDEVIQNAEVADTLSKQGRFVTEDLERGYQLVAEGTDLLLSETLLKFAD